MPLDRLLVVRSWCRRYGYGFGGGGCPWKRWELQGAAKIHGGKGSYSLALFEPAPAAPVRIDLADVRRVLDLLRWVGRTGWLHDGRPWQRRHLACAAATVRAGGGLVALGKVAA